MSEVTQSINDSNLKGFDYDQSKIFVFNNRYTGADFRNNTGALADFAPGLVVARNSSGEIVPFLAAGTLGIQKPIGILSNGIEQIADATLKADQSFCHKGDVVESKIYFQDASTLDTIVEERMVKDILQDVGINITTTTDMTGFDNA